MLTYFVQYLLVMYKYLWYDMLFVYNVYCTLYLCIFVFILLSTFFNNLKSYQNYESQKSKLIIWGPKIKDNLTKRQTCAAHEINFLISYS